MNEEAQLKRETALATVRSAVEAKMQEMEHSYREAAEAMGLPGGKNTVFRMLHYGNQRPNGQEYTPVTTIDAIAAGLTYAGMEFADLGKSSIEGSWLNVKLAIEQLPLPDDALRHLVHLMHVHYAYLCDEEKRRGNQEATQGREKSTGSSKRPALPRVQ